MPEIDETQFMIAPLVELSDRELCHEIVRLHMTTQPGSKEWEITNCWAKSKAGKPGRVSLPLTVLPRTERGAWSAALIQMFASQGRIARAMHVFDRGVITKEW